MNNLARRCKELSHGIRDRHFGATKDFEKIKDRASELMQLSIKERADELNKIKTQLPEHVAQQKAKAIGAQLKKLLPGGCSDISAMINEDGEICTKAEDIARLLNKHWQATFDEKSTDTELRKKWLQRVHGKMRVDKESLRPTRKDVEEAIHTSAASAPGPDLIPFEVYKNAGSAVVDLFLEVACAMLDGTDTPEEHFNLAFMICTPKKHVSQLDDGTQVFNASGTRPLSIVDCANRILSSIFRASLERNVGQYID